MSPGMRHRTVCWITEAVLRYGIHVRLIVWMMNLCAAAETVI